MRKAVLPTLGASLLAILSTAAFAADLPSRAMPPMFAPPVPIFTWTGFYVGANVGASFDEQRNNLYAFSNNGGPNTIAGSGGTDGILNLGGGNQVAFTGGGQIGYNYAFNPGPSVVAGLEADAQYLGQNSNGTTNYSFAPTTPFTYGVAFVPVPGLAPATIYRGGSRSDFFGTVRGRLGYAFDRIFVYGTGGLAYNENTIGYAVGGGIEYALTNNVTIRGEYLYVNLNKSGGTGINAVYDQPSNTLVLNSYGGRDDFSVARLAVNYKLNFGVPAPVVARY